MCWQILAITGVMIVFDVLCGCAGAVKTHNVMSSKLRDGFWHKAGFIGVIAFAVAIQMAAEHAQLGFEVPSVLAVFVYVIVTEAVIAGRYGTDDARHAALGDKYTAVQARVNELLSDGANAAGTSTGTPRIIPGSYKVVCSKLNVRDSPSTRNKPVADYVRGEVINAIAADTVAA